jgi:Uma2 family endonuclease
MSTAPKLLLTEQEYLARERAAEFKSEFYQGEMFAMAGTTREHNLIAMNIARVLGNQLVEKPCELYGSDMKVRVSPTGLYTYPDVAIACGQLQFADDQRDVLLNPTLIIEVLSPSTAAYDCGPKAKQYRQLESLAEFLLIDQNMPCGEHYVRDSGKSWRITPLDGLDTIIDLAAIGCQLNFADAYAKITFDPTAATLLRPTRLGQ